MEKKSDLNLSIDTSRFISFEGIDFSGKTTQINLLRQVLEEKGLPNVLFREPGGTSISEQIRHVLLDRQNHSMSDRAELFLYSAARVQLVGEKIIPLLQESYYVIADRYVDSTTAYQGYGRGIDLQVINQINHAATFGLLPGITFYLELPPEVARERRLASRRESDRLETAGIEFYRRVFQGYKEIALRNKQRYVVLDATKTVGHLHRQIIEHLNLT